MDGAMMVSHKPQRRLCREARWLHPSTLAAQNFIAAPGLKAPMNGFVVRIALRQHMPLRAGVEYPQYSFENTSGRDRLASRTSIGDMLFRKMIPDALPLLVCQPNHPTFIADRLRLAILR